MLPEPARTISPSDAILARYLTGGCSATEEREIAAWISTDPKRAERVSAVRLLLDASSRPPGWDIER